MKNSTGTQRYIRKALGVLLTGMLLAGCNFASERYHPDYPVYRKQIRRVLVLHPEISIFQELADGSMTRRMDKSQVAQAAMFKAVSEVLAQKDYIVLPVSPQPIRDAEIRSVQTLFRSVNRSIQLHAYGPQLYPSKIKSFEYEVGPVNGVLDQYRADALVLVVGHQTLSSQRPKTWISIAVVEPGGKVIWYGMQGAKGNLDLQSATGAQALANETLQPFSRVGS